MVVAIACHSANGLGRFAGSGNFKAFLGFDDEFGFPSKVPIPMMLAVKRGLECMFNQGHDLACAADQLRARFDQARIDYKRNGASYGLSVSETRTAWLFAKSNRYSVQTHGDTTTIL
jgi:hypothetical protein